jgi:glutathione S-transferase
MKIESILMLLPLTFYTNPMSRGRIVRWMLEEVGQPYATEIVAYGPAMRSAAYLAVNPMGKVPALRHGEVVVTETAAILAYLADAFPAAGLAPPPASPLRGPYYRWLFFTAGPLEAASSASSMGLAVPAEREAQVGYGSLARVLDTLEGALADRAHLVGDAFTAADLYLACSLGWLMQLGVIEKRLAFERYVGPHLARPAWLRATAIDDRLAAGQQ